MTLRMQILNGALLVRPLGELTESAASEMQVEIDKELAPAPRDIVLDLSGIQGLAVGALPYFFRIQKRARLDANRLFVAGAPESALRLFALTHVDSQLELVPDAAMAFRTVTR